MARKSTAIGGILASGAFYWALIRSIGSGWVEIGDVADLFRALRQVLFALIFDPLTWIALTIVFVLVFAHYPELRKRAKNGLVLTVNAVKRYKHYDLRLTVSAVFGILCVVLIDLWGQSHSWNNTVQGVIGSNRLQFTSENGRLGIFAFPNIQSPNYPRRDWTITSSPLPPSHIGFQSWDIGKMNPQGAIAVVPLWFVVLFVAISAAAPWLRWRFSLRTLLIATTFVAIVLGLVVLLSR